MKVDCPHCEMAEKLNTLFKVDSVSIKLDQLSVNTIIKK